MDSRRPDPFREDADAVGHPLRERVVGIALLDLLVLGWSFDVTPLAALRLWAADAVTALREEAAGAPAVVLVDIDDASLTQMGQWPWPRDLLANIVDRLADGGAGVVVLDILLAEPDRLSPARRPGGDAARTGADHDDVLAQAMRRLPVVGAALSPTSLPAEGAPMIGRVAVRGDAAGVEVAGRVVVVGASASGLSAAVRTGDGAGLSASLYQALAIEVGIPADLIDKVTQPFWQRQGPLVRSHGGVGLGLAIVKSHVDTLGGELRFDSVVDRGTTVTVLLPTALIAAQDEAGPTRD